MLFALADIVAGAILAVGLGCLIVVLRKRSRARLRIAGILGVIGVTLCAAIAALVIGTFRERVGPLVIATGGPANPSRTAVAPVSAHRSVGPAGTAGFEALGFLASDNDTAMNSVDENIGALTTLAATGLRLSAEPGRMLTDALGDSLQRAHLNGAQALITLSNYGATEFDGDLAAKVLNDKADRARLVEALRDYLLRNPGWDGVVLDLELLPASTRASYPTFLRELRAAVGRARIVLALPAFTSLKDPDAAAFDVPTLSGLVDTVVLMAYDHHETTAGPGDIAGIPWVHKVITEVTDQIGGAALHKFLLGIPSYGYLWPAHGQPSELTVAEARRLAQLPGARVRFDPVQAESRVALPDGSQAWFDDSDAVRARAGLARELGFAGIADWRIGGGDVLDSSQLGPVRKFAPQDLPGRPIERSKLAGLVALTFDDGPDPTWTPQILAVLRRLHVPATFFVIGSNAQDHPGLVRQEVREGHVVGNHTFSHHDLTHLSTWRSKAEILGGAAVIEGITGRKPLLFRAPYGANDSAGAGSRETMPSALGFVPVGWTVDTLDWTRPGVAAIVDAVAQPRSRRSIVLLHDAGGDRSQTVAALPRIVEELRARGYDFTTVDTFDASISSPYAQRRGLGSQSRGVAIIAGFRLYEAAQKLLLALLLGLALVAGWRLVVSCPLAVRHAATGRRRRYDPPPTGRPRVSILIPAHNEEAVLGTCLQTLLELAEPGCEVIVIDDGSTDDTALVAARHPIRLIRQRKQGKAGALNAGLRSATGEIVLVLDADTILGAGFLDAVCRQFTDPAVGAVAANIKVGNRDRFLPRLQALEYIVSLNLDRRAQSVLNCVTVVPGAAGAFRRAALSDVGGYPDRTLVEDADLTMNLLRAGWRIPYEPQAIAYTEAPQQVADVLKQRRRWSFGTIEVAAAHHSALFTRSGGRPGWLAIPWLILSQIVVPLFGPAVDAYLLHLALVGRTRQAAVMLGIALAMDLAVCALALHLDREDWSLLRWAPALRLVWRPLQLWAAMLSLFTWLAGGTVLWRRLTRHNSVRTTDVRLEAAEDRQTPAPA
jgi:peptidoglycan/xylan/chitin deacetylase (PgdA/CDA1 family)/spore germination protein YaaH